MLKASWRKRILQMATLGIAVDGIVVDSDGPVVTGRRVSE